MKTLTSKAGIATATTAELLAFYNDNTGGNKVNKFKDRTTAETRVCKLMDEMIADGDMEGYEVTAPEAKALPTPKELRAKGAAFVAAVEQAMTTPKAPKEPKVVAPKLVKTLFATDKATSKDVGIRADSFRGQILKTIIDNPGILKAEVVAKHAFYTDDVVCKFKRLGLIMERQ